MSRVRSQEGFTLMEVLVACTVGFVILAATLTLLDSSTRLNNGVLQRTDAMQRGRQSMDVLTQQLRSQVCLDYSHSAIIQGADANSVTFYDDYTEAGQKPDKRRIVFDTTKNQVRSELYKVSAGAPTPPLDTSYPASPTSIQNVGENVVRATDPTTKAPIPFLQYYAYPDPSTVTPGQELQPNVALTPGTGGLTKAQAARVARIDINFLARPTGAKDDSKGVILNDQVMARHADPNLSVPDPNCI